MIPLWAIPFESLGEGQLIFSSSSLSRANFEESGGRYNKIKNLKWHFYVLSRGLKMLSRSEEINYKQI